MGFAWMLEEVYLRTGGAYAHGFLTGAMCTNGPGPVYVVVRFEDIVLRPEQVADELARLGLPRSTAPFAPIEQSASGTADRAAIMARLARRDAEVRLEPAGCTEALAGMLARYE